MYFYTHFHPVSDMYNNEKLQYVQQLDPSQIYLFCHEHYQIAVRKMCKFGYVDYEVVYRGFDCDVLKEMKKTSGVNTWRVYSSSKDINVARNDFLSLTEFAVTYAYKQTKNNPYEKELPF